MQPRNTGGRPPIGMFGPPSPHRSGGMFGSPSPQRAGGMFGTPKMPGPQGTGGGLLSRLFQRQAPAQTARSAAAGMFSRAPQASGGLLQGLTNPGNLQSFLNNTQHVLKTAQQIGPMVQQYGPMVRNLPAMWKLYKGFKDSSEEQEGEVKGKESSIDALVESGKFENESSIQESIPFKKGKSVPKLYI